MTVHEFPRDHGSLANLDKDHHPQYLRKDSGAYPLGELGYAEQSSTQTGMDSTEVALNDLTVTASVAANRRIRVSIRLRIENGATGEFVAVRIKEDGTAIQTWGARTRGDRDMVLDEIVYTPSEGSHTWTVTFDVIVGTSSWSTVVADSSRVFIKVEDIGPA